VLLAVHIGDDVVPGKRHGCLLEREWTRVSGWGLSSWWRTRVENKVHSDPAHQDPRAHNSITPTLRVGGLLSVRKRHRRPARGALYGVDQANHGE